MSTVATLSVTAKADPVGRARALGPALAAAADEIERVQEIPEPLLSQLHEARLFRMLLPRSVGGDQVEPWIYLRAIEELARFDGSVGWNVFVGNSAALIAPYIPIEGARAIFGHPRGLIAWGPPNQHRAVAAPGGYRVTGEWHFASGSRQANWIGAHCHVVEPDGSLRLNRFGRPTVRTLLMPKEKSTPIRDWNTLGMRGTASEGYSIEDVFVPEEFSGTREDPTLRRDRGPLYAFTTQNLYAVGVAGVALGIARAMHEAFMALTLDKTPRYMARLADNPAVQAAVARHEAALGSEDRLSALSFAVAMNNLKTGSSQMAVQVINHALLICGLSGYRNDTPFSLGRHLRDAHSAALMVNNDRILANTGNLLMALREDPELLP